MYPFFTSIKVFQGYRTFLIFFFLVCLNLSARHKGSYLLFYAPKKEAIVRASQKKGGTWELTLGPKYWSVQPATSQNAY